jgi:hypothetical protein
MRSRQRSSPNNPAPGSYTAPQRERIRAALRAFFYAEGAAQTAYRFTWKDVEEAVLLYTNVKIDADSLNQFAESQVSRDKVRGSLPKNLQAIVDFLTDPEINALSLEELKEPEIPYHFALQLIEALRYRGRPPTLPPSDLKGTYRAVVLSDGKISDIRLTVIISMDGNLVHLAEEADLYRYNGVNDPADWSPNERKLNHQGFFECRGWGLLTPEHNLLGFMKLKVIDEYRDNYFYATMGVIPDFSDKMDIEQLALLAYDVPYGPEDEAEDKRRWFEEKCQKAVSKIRHFIRVPKDLDRMEDGAD